MQHMHAVLLELGAPEAVVLHALAVIEATLPQFGFPPEAGGGGKLLTSATAPAATAAAAAASAAGGALPGGHAGPTAGSQLVAVRLRLLPFDGKSSGGGGGGSNKVALELLILPAVVAPPTNGHLESASGSLVERVEQSVGGQPINQPGGQKGEQPVEQAVEQLLGEAGGNQLAAPA